MRLEEMTPAHVRRALSIYEQHAWPAALGEKFARSGPRTADFEDAATLEELFARFDRPKEGRESGLRRWTLRLGNTRYPFMKFVVQEYLVAGEFYFSVDTHDHLDIRPGMPDFDQWQELKLYNRELKLEIETGWCEAGLPTQDDLCRLAERLAEVERVEESDSLRAARRHILIVDDEEQVALGLGALLRAQGYSVDVVTTGEKALERLRDGPRPDLVLLDYELPGFDGQEVLGRIRADEDLEDLPVLMATASSIDLQRVPRVSGFLRKPYPRGVLFAMLDRLLGDPDDEEGDPARGRADSGGSPGDAG